MFDLRNIDCNELMKEFPDNHFDLAIVDVPYGIGANRMQLGNGKRKVYRGMADWDNEAPNEAYWNELFRVSKNQIVWGANHFISRIPFDSSCWLIWDKGTGDNDFADAEIAWTSFDKPVRKYKKSWVGANAKERDELDRMHPTQKPVGLYCWMLTKFAEKGFKILDTHLGSGSIALAVDSVNKIENMQLTLTGSEIDEKFYNDMMQRINDKTAQTSLFSI